VLSMTLTTITRRFEFDAAHRVWGHESKCKHIHGHRYVAEVTVVAPRLDDLGRVIDFGVVKEKVGAWIDWNWDHNILLNSRDDPLYEFLSRPAAEYDQYTGGRKPYGMDFGNPTAENIARKLYHIANGLLPQGIDVVHVRVYETPNCWSDYSEEEVK
jgi:6-pyruvoyltetrahydropterin/6-carboxytetrahydropterin synthase